MALTNRPLNMNKSEISLTPIGVVRSPVQDRREMSTLGVPARIEVFPQYREGLYQLEKHSHLWVLAWLDQADRDRLRVIPRGVDDRSEKGLHGVFAVRSPTRPNPVALTAARIIRLLPHGVEVDRLDFTDGTPVLDLKPYFRSKDCIFSARSEPIGHPATRDARLQSLVLQAVNFHGEFCRDLALAARIVESLRSEFLSGGDDEITATVPVARGCLTDALMGMLGVSPGRRTLEWADSSAIIFSRPGARYVFTLREHHSLSPDEILKWPHDQLFSRILE